MSIREIPVAPHVRGVVDNLRRAYPESYPPEVADWRIDVAHRRYSVSEDFGDDFRVRDWLPDDTEEEQWSYVNHCQIPDVLRTVHDLESYVGTLQKALGDATVQLNARREENTRVFDARHSAARQRVRDRVRAGEVDLRDVSVVMGEGFMQDFPAWLLS